MGVGNSAGGNILRVDPEMLSRLGNDLQTSANALPDPPAQFSVTGADAISLAIKDKVSELETPIIEGLPKVKAAASETAGNIIAAAQKYLGTDEDLASKYEQHRFDQTGSGGGGAGGAAGGGVGAGASAGAGAAAQAASGAGSSAGGGSDVMSQMMGMAGKAAEAPQQAMGALGGGLGGLMQGAQQVSQMAGKAGEGAGKGETAAPDSAQDPAQEQKAAEEKAAEERRQSEAAGGQHRSDRAPVASAPQSDSAVPDQKPSVPRHAAPDPTISL